jgi:L-iditol 2-dehydrogenase
VILVGTRPSRLELGRRLRADHVIDASAADPGPVTFDLSAVVRKDITIHTSRGEGGGNVRRAISLAAWESSAVPKW